MSPRIAKPAVELARNCDIPLLTEGQPSVRDSCLTVQRQCTSVSVPYREKTVSTTGQSCGGPPEKFVSVTFLAGHSEICPPHG